MYESIICHRILLKNVQTHVQKHIVLYMFLTSKNLLEWRIKARASHRVSSRLNHRASSFGAMLFIVMTYVFCSTWRLVTYVLRRTSRPTRPRHDVAWPGLHEDLFKAETGSEAGLGGADVAARTQARWRKSQRLERLLFS